MVANSAEGRPKGGGENSNEISHEEGSGEVGQDKLWVEVERKDLAPKLVAGDAIKKGFGNRGEGGEDAAGTDALFQGYEIKGTDLGAGEGEGGDMSTAGSAPKTGEFKREMICRDMMKRLAIIPGVSWGVAEKSFRQKWKRLGCDGVVIAGGNGEPIHPAPPRATQDCTAR